MVNKPSGSEIVENKKDRGKRPFVCSKNKSLLVQVFLNINIR